jgi:hypothetical protein
MPHVFRFGPLTPDEPAAHVYIVLDDAGENTLTGFVAADPIAALARVHAEFDGALTCDPELAEFRGELGFTASDGPGDMAMWRLGMPLSYAYGRGLESPEIELLVVFARAGGAFDAARAALTPHFGRPFEVTLTGSFPSRHVGLIHGDENRLGLTVVKDRATFDRMERLIFAGLPEDAAALGLLLVSFELAPASYLGPSLAKLDARGLAVGLRLDGDVRRAVSVEEVWALAAAMHALSTLKPGELAAEARLSILVGQAVDISVRFLNWELSVPLNVTARA